MPAGAAMLRPVVAMPASVTLDAGMDETLSDEELMLRYGAGDAAAFDALYARHKGGVYRYLLRQLREPAIAEELFQDIWLNLVNARERYTVQARFSTWLYRIAHNRLVDHVRRQGNTAVVSINQNDEDDDPPLEIADDTARTPEARQWATQQLERIVELVEALPAAQREAFLLYHEGDLGVDDIAEATGVNRETAKSRLRYAFNKLRKGLEDYL
jgi:RNA polymerase sigma-70 factor (ECF subfamily)